APIRAFGFSAKEWQFQADVRRLNVMSETSLAEGRVTDVFEEWRVEPRPPAPAILGNSEPLDEQFTDFPCFETTAPFEPGMSGGPVFLGDTLFGIVSTGWPLEQEAETNATQSRAASLWPLFFVRNIT